MIIIAPDKFKGTMTADVVANTIAEALRECGSQENLMLYPMADGGDGTAAVLQKAMPGIMAIEAHRYIGPENFDNMPMTRSSYSLGVAIDQAVKSSGKIYVGIGGTACCDGGAGLLQAMGMKAYSNDGSIIKEHLCPANILKIERLDFSALPNNVQIVALSDVEASLVPADGMLLSALDFARQKGFTEIELTELGSALKHFKRLASPGFSSVIDGAGGGVGFALGSVLRTEIKSGASFITDCYEIPFDKARLVISGEGCIDSQTAGGKVVDVLYQRAKEAGVPFLAIGGKVSGKQEFPTIAIDGMSAPLPADTREAQLRLKRAIVENVKQFALA
ncbi:MAG: glycerate kinase [Clostridiales bacterium]|nr:glycerate kinase [Clostridiales bacterium]